MTQAHTFAVDAAPPKRPSHPPSGRPMQPEMIPINLPLAFLAVYALAGGILMGERKRAAGQRS